MLGNRHAQTSFAQVPSVSKPRSVFNRSMQVKDTMLFDQVVPIFVDEILPGDTVNMNISSFCRLATQVVPLLDRAYIDIFAFYAPSRILWDNFEKFQGYQRNPGDSTDFTIPQIVCPAVNGAGVNTLWDKFGLPTQIPSLSVNSLPFRMNNLIFNEWFRDQNYQDSMVVDTDDGPDTYSDYFMFVRNKKRDYFSSAFPEPQKGDAVDIPLGTQIPIMLHPTSVTTNAVKVLQSTNHAAPAAYNGLQAEITPNGRLVNDAHDMSYVIDPNSTLYGDTGDLAGTINELREAIQTQAILELDARGGTRYIESLWSRWGVISPDFRLQRPEYLGGGEIEINSHPVPQTSATSGSNYQGDLASFGTAGTSRPIGFTKSFTEHGYVIIYACARGEVTYQGGIERMWSRSTRWDLYEPLLANLGEQAILQKELSATGTPAVDNAVIGYQEHWADYRYKPSLVKGQFRSNYAQSLDSWHLAEDYGTLTIDDLIPQATPIERNLANPSANVHLLCDWFFDYRHARCMPTYSIPAALGRL